MVLGLLGLKVGMTQIYDDQGKLAPVTVLRVGPCPVLQVREQERDGYDALQLGFLDKQRRKATRPVPVKSPSARLSLLSPKRQAIIRSTFERPREFVLLSVRALAERLGTDPATMIRIVRGLQFASYREFQHYCTNYPSLTRPHWIPCELVRSESPPSRFRPGPPSIRMWRI